MKKRKVKSLLTILSILSGKTFWEEIGRFENFDAGMTFTPAEWRSFSQSLRSYVMARRLLNKVSNELNPEPTRHEVDTDDSINHTVEWTWMQDPSQMHSSTRVEKTASGIRRRRGWLFNANNCLEHVVG